MITVGELIERLKTFDPDWIVPISPDEEGNNLHAAYGVGHQYYHRFSEEDHELFAIASEDRWDYPEEDIVSVAEVW